MSMLIWFSLMKLLEGLIFFLFFLRSCLLVQRFERPWIFLLKKTILESCIIESCRDILVTRKVFTTFFNFLINHVQKPVEFGSVHHLSRIQIFLRGIIVASIMQQIVFFFSNDKRSLYLFAQEVKKVYY